MVRTLGSEPFARIAPRQQWEKLCGLARAPELGEVQTLVDWLRQRQPEVKWTAASTVQQILKQAGLIEGKRQRRRVGSVQTSLQLGAVVPHEVLPVDFKGEFRTQDRRYCYPLTIANYPSRYLLACRARW